ncbi:MAG: hypothetical protein V7K50_11730 [Nostoc sp.]
MSYIYHRSLFSDEQDLAIATAAIAPATIDISEKECRDGDLSRLLP